MAVEIVITQADQRREAWDSSNYWIFGIPSMMLASLICGLYARRNSIALGYAPFVGQMVTMMFRAGVGSMLPLGAILIGILGLSGVLAALVGKVIGKRLLTSTAEPASR